MRQNHKLQGIGDVVGNLGFAFEFFKVIAHAVMAKGGTMQHLKRVVKEGDLQKRIADLIVPVGSTATKPLGENEYLVPVTYTLPTFADLELEFGKGNVSNLYDGRPFKMHRLCNGMDLTSGDRVMLLKQYGRVIKNEAELEAEIVEMDKLGYRPATHFEAYAFQKANPDLQRQFWIVAAGSSAVLGGNQYVAMLLGDSGRRVFGNGWLVGRWSASFRFLFVRK